MLSKAFVTVCAVVGSLAATAFVVAQSEPDTTPDAASGAPGLYADVNGVHLYYEVSGSGDPLVVLHGGLGSTDMFAALAPALAQNRQVIAVDLQGHGRTADVDRPMTFEAMADDVAALLGELGLPQADIMGYSLGGGVALQVAIRHPEVVRKLVLVSTAFSLDGWYPEVQAGMAAMNADAAPFMLETPMYQLYSSVAPRVEDWPVLLGKLGALLSAPYDWSAEVANIDVPALIVIGDADSIVPEHALALYRMFGGAQHDGGMGGVPASQFAVVPNTVHWNILMRADLLLPIITPFLDAPLPEATA